MKFDAVSDPVPRGYISMVVQTVTAGVSIWLCENMSTARTLESETSTCEVPVKVAAVFVCDNGVVEVGLLHV